MLPPAQNRLSLDGRARGEFNFCARQHGGEGAGIRIVWQGDMGGAVQEDPVSGWRQKDPGCENEVEGRISAASLPRKFSRVFNFVTALLHAPPLHMGHCTSSPQTIAPTLATRIKKVFRVENFVELARFLKISRRNLLRRTEVLPV